MRSLPAFWTIAFCPALLPVTAAAQTVPLDIRPDLQRRAWETASTILFAGVDLGRSTFVTSGFLREFGAPEGERRFVLAAINGAGIDQQRARPRMAAYRDRTAQNAFLVGYRWPTGTGSLTLLAGAESDLRQQEGKHQRIRGGARLTVDLWHHPGPDSLVTATFVAGTARPAAWARVALGRAWADAIYAGPEASLHVEEGYLQWRLGVHLTGLRLWRLEGRASAGLRSDSDAMTGAYWSFSAHIRL